MRSSIPFTSPTSPTPRLAARSLPGLAAASALVLCAWAAPAGAQSGSLRFDRLTTESCNEMGSCEWRLACKVGSGAEAELVPNAVLKEDQSADIGRTEAVARFPVTVQCTLAEDDGWFGATWEPAGTGSIAVPSGGSYTLELGNAEQGKVKVELTADSLEGRAAAPAAAPAGKAGTAAKRPARQYFGVYRSDPAAGHAVVVGLDETTFQARARDFFGRGLQLVDVETWGAGKERVWSGVFRTAEGASAFESGLEWEPFVAKNEELKKKGLVLTDFETYAEGKKRLFAGAFRETSDIQTLWVGQEEKPFNGKVSEMTGQGLRLVDVDAYRAGKQLFYSGVFLKGTGSFAMWTALDWPAFALKWKESNDRGQRLVDLETFEDGKKRLYMGVFRGGSDDSTLVGGDVDWTAFAARWQENVGKGIRLVDLESIPE